MSDPRFLELWWAAKQILQGWHEYLDGDGVQAILKNMKKLREKVKALEGSGC